MIDWVSLIRPVEGINWLAIATTLVCRKMAVVACKNRFVLAKYQEGMQICETPDVMRSEDVATLWMRSGSST
jgi:hypothetical protein